MVSMTSLAVPIQMRFADIDSYGHVNNVTQLQYLEDARVRLSATRAQGIEGVPDGVSLGDLSGTRLKVVGRQEVEYLAQLHYRLDPVTVEVWVSHIGATSYVLNYRLCDHPQEESGNDPTVYAIGQSTTVQIGRESGRPERLNEQQRAFLEHYSGDPVTFGRRPAGD